MSPLTAAIRAFVAQHAPCTLEQILTGCTTDDWTRSAVGSAVRQLRNRQSPKAPAPMLQVDAEGQYRLGRAPLPRSPYTPAERKARQLAMSRDYKRRRRAEAKAAGVKHRDADAAAARLEKRASASRPASQQPKVSTPRPPRVTHRPAAAPAPSSDAWIAQGNRPEILPPPRYLRPWERL